MSEQTKNLLGGNYNPDVLECLANLSNDEVFTPPKVVNQMLDMLPPETWSNPNLKFLDPACKTGVFLREIAKRLIVGLKEQIPDLQQRLDHIFHNQLYGIAITELTALASRRSLYCSKYANGKYSVSKFDNPDGNIRFVPTNHTWENGKCKYCGANASQYQRADDLETHAYEFIHTNNPEEIFGMKFDVIIGNPPYHLNDGGGTGTSARPIYQLFVNNSFKLKPKYSSMIIPAKWYSGGKGLDLFRDSMLNDRRIEKLIDFENYKEVFPGLGGLAGGACIYLWNRDANADTCEVISVNAGKETAQKRRLNEFDYFIRQNNAIDIVNKIRNSHHGKYIDARISTRLPFGITTTYEPKREGVPCWFTQKIGRKYVSEGDYSDPRKIINKWKFLIPKAPIAGQTDFTKPVGFYYDGNTRIAKPGEICSESWLVAGAFDSEDEAKSYKSYLLTKVSRFLLLQTIVSQNTSKKNFCFIPDVERYDHVYSDEELCKRWAISNEEYEYIKTRIGEIGKGANE